MSASCKSLPVAMYLDDAPPLFEARLERLDTWDWKHLNRCRFCGQLWRTDEWDKYVTQFAIKLDRSEAWREFNSVSLEKELLLRSRGGTEPGECAWVGCKAHVLRGFALCVDHVYASNIRR